MFRMNRLTDYGIVLLAHVAREGGTGHSARELAAATRIPQPTVGKLLKLLVREGLLVSQRGREGGYALARDPRDLSLAEVIAALEGPISLTECNLPVTCEHETGCPTRTNWQLVNRTILDALSRLSLAEMARPLTQATKSRFALPSLTASRPPAASAASAASSPSRSTAP
jgi:FeS assembly SUF system regulator